MIDRYATLRQGLVGAWCPSLGDSGYILRCRSGRYLHGTLTNMGGQVAYQPIRGGLALRLVAASSNYVDTPATISGLSVVTVSAWMRPTATNQRMEINQGTDSTTRATYSLAEDGNAYLIPASTGGYGACNWSSLGVSAPIHFVGVFNAGGTNQADRGKIYLNGVRQTLTLAGAGFPTTAPTFTGRLRIGVRPDNVSFSDGWIDDIRIYNRELTLSEIKLLASQRGIGLVPTRHRRARLAAATTTVWLNVGGTWKATTPKINVAGTWKTATPKVNVSGTWKG